MRPTRQPADFRQVRDRPGQHLPPEPPLLHRAGVRGDQPGPLHGGDLLHLRLHRLEALHRHHVPGIGVRLRVAEVHGASHHLERSPHNPVHTSSIVRAREWPGILGALVSCVMTIGGSPRARAARRSLGLKRIECARICDRYMNLREG